MNKTGQAVLESLLSMGLMLILILVGIILTLRGLGSIIATKWAAENSHCIASQRSSDECADFTKQSLENHFAFKNVQVKSFILEGAIHSEVKARLLGQSILLGTYDLAATEYKRVSE